MSTPVQTAGRGSRALVSIALPVYNGERFVGDAIESILSQDFTDFELVISDNASTDATSEICRRFVERDPRVCYVRNSQNIGIAANFTQSFGLVSGRYFKWMAADDMLAPGYVQACVQILESDPSIVLVTSKPTLVGEDGRTPLQYDAIRGVFVGSYVGLPIESAEPYMTERPSKRFRSVLLSMPGRAINNFACGLMRSEFVLQNLPFGPYIGFDKVFLAGLSLHGKLALIDKPLFIWRHHKAQFSMMSGDDATKAVAPVARGNVRSWRMSQVRAYVRTAMASPISMGEKARCLLTIIEKVFQGSMRSLSRSLVRNRAAMCRDQSL
jgi:glycosyltransferase involved in cell wall biosynthesis